MDMGLSGKRALITGSSAGLGGAIAEMLAAEGVSVVVHGRDVERAEAVAAGICARAVVTPSSRSATWRPTQALTLSADAARDVDILVNNAGRYDGLPWSKVSTQMWAQIYQVNVIVGCADDRTPGARDAAARLGPRDPDRWGIGDSAQSPSSRITTPRWRPGTTSRCRWRATSRAPASPRTPSHPVRSSPSRYAR